MTEVKQTVIEKLKQDKKLEKIETESKEIKAKIKELFFKGIKLLKQ